MHARHVCPCVWQLPWLNCDPPNAESPIFIEMGVILTSSGRNSHTPIKVMPVDTMGAVTIYSVTPLNNGFSVRFVLKILPLMLDSRMLQTQAGAVGQRLSLLPGGAMQPGPGCREHLPVRSGRSSPCRSWPAGRGRAPWTRSSAHTAPLTVHLSGSWKEARCSIAFCQFHSASGVSLVLFFPV